MAFADRLKLGKGSGAFSESHRSKSLPYRAKFGRVRGACYYAMGWTLEQSERHFNSGEPMSDFSPKETAKAEQTQKAGKGARITANDNPMPSKKPAARMSSTRPAPTRTASQRSPVITMHRPTTPFGMWLDAALTAAGF